MPWRLHRILEEGLASSLTEAMEQPTLLANDVMWVRAYAKARDNISNPNVKSDQIPDDAPHSWAKRIKFYRMTGRWPSQMTSG